ncbi:MAG: hypothetical protein ACLUDQ_14430 [Bilophila wadsworthia]
MESMSVLERLSELLPALPPGLIEAWGQLVLFAVPVCLYLAAVVLPFVVLYGLIRAHFGRRSLLERCSRQQARFANFLNWLFLVCFVALAVRRPLRDVPPLYRAGLYLSAGLCLAAPSSDRRGGVEAGAVGPCCTVSSRSTGSSLACPHHRAYSGPRLAGHGAAAEATFRRDRSPAAFRQ